MASNDGMITRYTKIKERVTMPNCEWKCGRTAQYDFVDKQGHWRYGCMNHWMDHRASKQLGPGHGRHLTLGVEPPDRPEGQDSPPPLDPTELARPRIAMTLREQMKSYTHIADDGSVDQPKSQARGHVTRKVNNEKKIRIREFHDMPPTGEDIKPFKPGSVMAVTVELMEKQDGATVEEIQAAIGPKHQALKLMQWMNENKGIGFKMGEDGKIRPVYRGAS